MRCRLNCERSHEGERALAQASDKIAEENPSARMQWSERSLKKKNHVRLESERSHAVDRALVRATESAVV